MKFCPICQRDFDDETMNCPTCGQALLRGEHLENEVIFDYPKESVILKLYNYLCENDFHSVQYYQDIKTEHYYITASCEESAKALQAVLLCINDESGSLDITNEEREEIAKQIESVTGTIMPDEGAKKYVNAKERYDNMMSSASSLIIVGLMGFAFVTLVYLKLINLEMNILFYVLSLLMFSAFIILGGVSFIKAGKIKNTISTEENLADAVKKFLLTEYCPADSENEAAMGYADSLEEEKYFFRTEHMKNAVLERFENADELLVDGMIEDVYNSVYPIEKEKTEEIEEKEETDKISVS